MIPSSKMSRNFQVLILRYSQANGKCSFLCFTKPSIAVSLEIINYTACPNKHCAWQNRRFSQKSGRLANRILWQFQAYSLVYNWWKNNDNPSMQTGDIFDLVRLCVFRPAQCNFHTSSAVLALLECVTHRAHGAMLEISNYLYRAFEWGCSQITFFGYNLISLGMHNIKC